MKMDGRFWKEEEIDALARTRWPRVNHPLIQPHGVCLRSLLGESCFGGVVGKERRLQSQSEWGGRYLRWTEARFRSGTPSALLSDPFFPPKVSPRASGISGLWGSLKAEEELLKTWRHHVTGFSLLPGVTHPALALSFFFLFSPAPHSSPSTSSLFMHFSFLSSASAHCPHPSTHVAFSSSSSLRHLCSPVSASCLCGKCSLLAV